MRLHTGIAEFYRHEVYLDGKLLENCIEANDESGIVFVLDLDAAGSVQWEHGSFCAREEWTATVFVYDQPTNQISKILTSCDCPLKTKMLRGRVEFRRRMSTRHEWVSPSKEDS
ncbi:MAG TPA: hypothetical protein VF735_08930 [Pyrinomonadaceae bacterium]|jgi:hypothetical protein